MSLGHSKPNKRSPLIELNIFRLKAEELEKKLEEEIKKRMEIENREEQLLKRITEKEKAYTKLQ